MEIPDVSGDFSQEGFVFFFIFRGNIIISGIVLLQQRFREPFVWRFIKKSFRFKPKKGP